MMYHREGEQYDFEYPLDRNLFKLQGILNAEQMTHPTAKDFNGNLVRLVIKNGYTTGITIDFLSRFLSRVRLYGLTGTFDSIEAPVLPYSENKYFGAFSRGGDSGAIVGASVGTADCPEGMYASLLTGGTGPSDRVDITYTTPLNWLWYKVIVAKFPGAVLYWN